MLYSVDDIPPWHLSCLLGFQVLLFHHLCYVFLLVFYCCCYGCGRARVLVIRPAALLLSNFNVRIYFWNGMQHYLMMFGGTISVPFILTPALCIEEDDPVRSAIVSTIIFVSGIVTLLQCTVGVRLPIIQGGTFSFLVPTFAILSLPEWQCPPAQVLANMTYEDKTELWQMRMREVQGAIVVASVFQVAIGAFGSQYIRPFT